MSQKDLFGQKQFLELRRADDITQFSDFAEKDFSNSDICKVEVEVEKKYLSFQKENLLIGTILNR
jgi:hypothetical protein